MQQYPGTFIVLEGADGSGKNTQIKLLAERLRAVGHEVEVFEFPRYDQPSSHFVRRYLNGDYGPASEVSPYAASMFFALDRFETAPLIRKAHAAGKVVLADRYAGSNMAHQGAKFASEAEQRGFFIWADSLEFQLLGIPRPSINIFLRVPAEISFKLIGQKPKRDYTDKSHDEHEADINHLTRSVATYDTLCRLFPKDFIAIECSQGGQLMAIPTISDIIWQTIQPLLPEKPRHRPRAGVARLGVESEKVPVEAPKKSRLSLLALIELVRIGDYHLKNPHLDWLDNQANQSFYTPPQLNEKTRAHYLETMQRLAKIHRRMRDKTAKFSPSDVEAVLSLAVPMASYASVELNEQDLEKAAADSSMAELKALAGSTQNARAKANNPSELTNLVRDSLPTSLSLDMEPLTLLEAWPRNEFELLSDGLYGFSDLPRQDVQSAVEGWTYDQKYKAMGKILKNSDSSVLSQVRYRWDVVADQKLLMELVEGGYAQSLRLQAPTPRYGYDVPEKLAEMGIEDDFITCFDESLQLYSQLQSSEQPALAGYAVLTGHKVRFEFTEDLNSLTQPREPGSSQLNAFLKALNEKISELHPLIGDFLAKNGAPQPKAKPAPASPRPKRRRRRSK